MVKPSCLNFRVITADFSGVRIFRKFTVDVWVVWVVILQGDSTINRREDIGYLMVIKVQFSTTLHKNIRCGYSLEFWYSLESPQHCRQYFYGEIWKIIPKLSSNTHLICSFT